MGLLLAYIFGYLFGWRVTSLISCGISLLSTLLLLYAPETPYWLIQQNDVKEARYDISPKMIKKREIVLIWIISRASLRKIRGECYYNLETELEEISNAKNWNQSKGLMRILFSRIFLKPFVCVGITLILYQLSSFSILTTYTATIFEFMGIIYDPLAVSIGYGTIRLISSMCLPVFLAMLTKRLGLMSFGIASTLAMLASMSILHCRGQ